MFHSESAIKLVNVFGITSSLKFSYQSMQFGESPKNHKTLNFDRVKLPHETTSKNLRDSLKTPLLTTLSTLFNSDPFYYISMFLGGKANEIGRAHV